jgi:hypothetical protein
MKITGLLSTWRILHNLKLSNAFVRLNKKTFLEKRHVWFKFITREIRKSRVSGCGLSVQCMQKAPCLGVCCSGLKYLSMYKSLQVDVNIPGFQSLSV